jgi:hypothetical protein
LAAVFRAPFLAAVRFVIFLPLDMSQTPRRPVLILH